MTFSASAIGASAGFTGCSAEVSVLASAGFEVEESDFASTLSKEVVERRALASEDVSNIVNHIFVVHKPKI